jgi:hypothetical protein
MKEISITGLLEELQKAKEEGFDYVLFEGTVMLSDNTIIVSTEKQM